MTLGQILESMQRGYVTTQICESLEHAILVSRACVFSGYPAAISMDQNGNLFVLIKKKAIVH